MVKQSKGILASLFVICLLVVNSFAIGHSSAYLTGRISVNSQYTSSHQPIITGSLPSWCNDIAIGIYGPGDTKGTFYFSDYGAITLTSNTYSTEKTWSLNSQSVGLYLANGSYDIFAASECDYSGTYGDPLYADYHYSVLSIVPNACDDKCVPVYRFYNTQTGAHFYTTSENEKRNVLDMTLYRYEGIVNYAKYYRTALPGLIPVHRFYNFKTGVHFYTSNQAEATTVNNSMYDTYRYEGVAYYNISNM